MTLLTLRNTELRLLIVQHSIQSHSRLFFKNTGEKAATNDGLIEIGTLSTCVMLSKGLPSEIREIMILVMICEMAPIAITFSLFLVEEQRTLLTKFENMTYKIIY